MTLVHKAVQKSPVSDVKIIGLRGAVSSADKLRSLDLEIASKGMDLQTNWWQPLSDANLADMRDYGQSIAMLRQRPTVEIAQLDKLLRASGLTEGEIIALPLATSVDSWTVLMNRQSVSLWGICR